MSAKSKVEFPASPTKTLVSATRLAAIQRANGSLMVLQASCPGEMFQGTKTFLIKIRGLRFPYLGIRFRITVGSGTPFTAPHSFKLRELESASDTITVNHFERTFSKSTSKDYVHVHRLLHGIGAQEERLLTSTVVDPDLPPLRVPESYTLSVYDPTVIRLKFHVDTINGTGAPANYHLKNIVVFGFHGYDQTQPGEGIPFRVRANDAYVEEATYSETR